MKILHINSYYSGSKFYKNLYDYQIDNGIDINVFVPVSSSNINDKDFGPYTTISKNHTKFDRFVFHLKQNKIYSDIINKYCINEFSIIHAHSLFTNGYIAMKLKKEFGVPYIVAVRNTDVNIFFNKMIHLRQIGIKILENADKVIFLSESYRDKVLERHIPSIKKTEIYNKTSIIPNGIDDYWFNNIVNQKIEPNTSRLKLLHVGDIDRNKNIEKTVKAIALLIEKNYHVSLDVVGKVKDRKLFNKIKNLNFINYLGTKPKEELIEIYRNNDIFVLPSIHETFGLVYAEAMSQGLPVIYTKGQGFDGQFPNGEIGYSVNSKLERDIAMKIEQTVVNYRILSVNCINRVQCFTWENIGRKYSDLYNSIIKE